MGNSSPVGSGSRPENTNTSASSSSQGKKGSYQIGGGYNQNAGDLSGGNQQKIVIAKGLATKPDILILDEPTRGIDVGSKAELYEIMNNLVEQGVSIIMISSELPELLNMSDRIIIMREGVISGELSAEEATEETVMAYATKEMN